MKMRFRRQFIAFAGAIVLVLPLAGGNALADSPVETAIKDLVAAIDGSPSWTASYRSLSYDAGADTALLSGLAIATKKGDLKIDFESISVAGYAPAADYPNHPQGSGRGGRALRRHHRHQHTARRLPTDQQLV